ncbi:hypothetical protein [Streptomyces sp. NL15-2K]|uniref:hypothetical protein n=1 Tax=Streptomyces sp. NL15-2K TaxID=376149 RepID=UPI00209BCFB6|nr:MULTISPECIES: hypothetical protein [Actinomycetes]WKX11455.1 hypothetical protein Q4V64_29665 [Kutzneria buriramensis]
MTVVKAREVVDVVTDRVTFTVAAKQELSTPDGWVPAVDGGGCMLAWTHTKKLCRERLTIRPGYEFGYFVGATCADGTVGKNCLSLVVDEEDFAARYAECLTKATGLLAQLEPVTRPSGYLKRDVPGFRVRVVSSYLANAMRQHVGGDAHHMDGYIDGDGFRHKKWDGRTVVSSNVPFLEELAGIIGARFTPRPKRSASALVVTDRWKARSTFHPEYHPLEPDESTWVEVRDVRLRRAEGAKPFTLYSYRLDPHPGFLVSGHLARQPW